jgi:hypothetical protein
MNKNGMMRLHVTDERASHTAKSISVKVAWSRFRGCAQAVVEITPGELARGRETGKAARRSEERARSQQKA